MVNIFKFSGWRHIILGSRVVVTDFLAHWTNTWKIWNSGEFSLAIDLPFWFLRVWRR